MVALKANEAMAKANLNIALQNEKLASHKAKYEDLFKPQNKMSPPAVFMKVILIICLH